MGALADQFHLTNAQCPPDCDESVEDLVCGVWVCVVHTPDDEIVECVESKLRLHHVDCRSECEDCQGAAAQDDYEDRYERTWRGED